MDFTIKTYRKLLTSLTKAGYVFVRFDEYMQEQKTGSSLNTHSLSAVVPGPTGRRRSSSLIILRHDVDRLPQNALRTAQIEHSLGIRGSYYFRIVPESWDEDVIRKIAGMGHEVGYHYEDVDLAGRMLGEAGGLLRRLLRRPGSAGTPRKIRDTLEGEGELLETAMGLFEKHLQQLRTLVPVETICMHGSPMSRYDNRMLWERYDYRDYGITGEPYFDVDFSEVLYLTDTGRRWDGEKVSVRDKVRDSENREPRTGNCEPGTFHSTFDIIRAAEEDRLPRQVMLTVHPQRWTGSPVPWMKELVWQGAKNEVKRWVVRRRQGNL